MEDISMTILFWLLSKKYTKTEIAAAQNAAIEHFDTELDKLRKNLSAISACEVSNGEIYFYIPASYGNIENGQLFINFTTQGE